MCNWRKPIRCKEIVPLNSVVSELVNLTVGRPTTIFFKRPTKGWLHIKLTHNFDMGLVRLDKKPIRLCSGEAMRFVSAGKHKLEVPGGCIIVRAIPEIAFYDFHPPTAGVVRYWTDIKKYDIWNNYNVMVSALGKFDTYAACGYVAEWRAKGGKWIANATLTDNWHDMMLGPVDGIIVDEFLTRMIDSFPAWADIIRTIKADPACKGKMFYGFLPGHAKAEYDVLVKAILESGYKVAPEGYLKTYATEKEENKVLHWYAGAVPRWWIELYGQESINQMLFTLCPSDSGKYAKRWNRFDHVDFKVHLDKTFYEIVNSEGFVGLGGVSFWRALHTSKDTMSHVNALVRHYLIEGNRERMTNEPYIRA